MSKQVSPVMRWFAWRPVKTQEDLIVWLRRVWKVRVFYPEPIGVSGAFPFHLWHYYRWEPKENTHE